MSAPDVSNSSHLSCPVSHVVFQDTGLQAPRQLDCCKASVSTAALQTVLCTGNAALCPICNSILPFHNSTDYKLDFEMIKRLRAFHSSPDRFLGTDFASARNRLQLDRGEPVDLFVTTSFPEAAQALPMGLISRLMAQASTVSGKLDSTGLCGDAGNSEGAYESGTANEQNSSASVTSADTIIRIPPQGFILKISRGILIGRLRHLIASKMGVHTKYVQLKLVSKHTLHTPPQLSAHVRDALNPTGEGGTKQHAPFSVFSQQAPNTPEPACAIPAHHAERHGECSFSHDLALPGTEFSAPMAKLDPVDSTQAAEVCRHGQSNGRGGHLKEWQPKCPGVSGTMVSNVQQVEAAADPARLGGCMSAAKSSQQGLGEGGARISAGVHPTDVDMQPASKSRDNSRSCANSTGAIANAASVISGSDTEFFSVDSHRVSTTSLLSLSNVSCSGGGVCSGRSSADTSDRSDGASQHTRSGPMAEGAAFTHVLKDANDPSPSSHHTVPVADDEPSPPLSTAELSILSAEATLSGLSSDCCDHTRTQNQVPDSITPDTLLESFEHDCISLVEPGWETTCLDQCSVEIEDDKRSLWDYDGRDRCMGLWKDVKGKWTLAAFKPHSQKDSEWLPMVPVPLEDHSGGGQGKLMTRILIQASIDFQKMAKADLRALHQTACLQKATARLQKPCNGPSFSGWPFQERVCVAKLTLDGPREKLLVLTHTATVGHCILDQKDSYNEDPHGYGDVSNMQRLSPCQIEGCPDMKNLVCLMAAPGHIIPRKQGCRTLHGRVAMATSNINR